MEHSECFFPRATAPIVDPTTEAKESKDGDMSDFACDIIVHTRRFLRVGLFSPNLRMDFMGETKSLFGLKLSVGLVWNCRTGEFVLSASKDDARAFLNRFSSVSDSFIQWILKWGIDWVKVAEEEWRCQEWFPEVWNELQERYCGTVCPLEGAKRVFLSFSRDSEGHLARILALADALCTDGLEVIFDQPEMSFEQGRERKIQEEIETCDFVLLICSERFAKNFEGAAVDNEGGDVYFETVHIVASGFGEAKHKEKFVPVLIDGESDQSIPSVLDALVYFRLGTFTTDDPVYAGLIRHLTGRTRTVPISLGEREHRPSAALNDVRGCAKGMKRADQANAEATIQFEKPVDIAAIHPSLSPPGVLFTSGDVSLFKENLDFLEAVATNDLDAVRQLVLIGGSDVNVMTLGLSPVTLAVKRGHDEVLAFLQSRGGVGPTGMTKIVEDKKAEVAAMVQTVVESLVAEASANLTNINSMVKRLKEDRASCDELDGLFRAFLLHVSNPDPATFQLIAERRDFIMSQLRGSPYPGEGPLKAVFFSGSYSRGVEVYPHCDIDIFAVFSEQFLKATETIEPETLRSFFFDVIFDHFVHGTDDVEEIEGAPFTYVVRKTDPRSDNVREFVIRRQGFSVGICFGRRWDADSITFDIVPAAGSRSSDVFRIFMQQTANAITTNPKAARAWLEATCGKSKLNASLKDLIRLTKLWNSISKIDKGGERDEKPLKSFAIELCCCWHANHMCALKMEEAPFVAVFARLMWLLCASLDSKLEVPGVDGFGILFGATGGQWTTGRVRNALESAAQALNRGLSLWLQGHRKGAVDSWVGVLGSGLVDVAVRLGIVDDSVPGAGASIEKPRTGQALDVISFAVDKANVQKLLFRCVSLGRLELCAALLASGAADPNASEDGGDSVLYCAVSETHEEADLTRLLLLFGANVNYVRASDGMTPLFAAASRGHETIVQSLLRYGAVMKRGSSNLDALGNAVKCGRSGVVRLLLASSDSSSRLHALNQACIAEEVDTVLALVPHVELSDLTFKDREPPLHLAALKGNVQLVDTLVKHGVSPVAKDRNGVSALYVACLEGHLAVVEILLKLGCRPDTVDELGRTELHVASYYGHTAIVSALLEYVPVDIVDNDGKTALTLACARGLSDVAAILLSRSAGMTPVAAEALSTRGHLGCARRAIEAHQTDWIRSKCDDVHGLFPLHLGASWGHRTFCVFLLEHGADEGAIDDRGYSALHLAVEQGRTNVVELLLKQSIVVGSSLLPIHSAVSQSNIDLTLKLLLAGSPYDVPLEMNERQLTPLALAMHNESFGTAALIALFGVPDSDFVHATVQCDGCEQYPVIGPCYKCQVCNDFDLCQSCLNRLSALHGHTFAQRAWEVSDQFEVILRSMKEGLMRFEAASRPIVSTIQGTSSTGSLESGPSATSFVPGDNRRWSTHVAGCFQTFFDDRIKVPDGDLKLVADRTRWINDALRERSCFHQTVISGSFGRQTFVAPLHDVDLLAITDKEMVQQSSPQTDYFVRFFLEILDSLSDGADSVARVASEDGTPYFRLTFGSVVSAALASCFPGQTSGRHICVRSQRVSVGLCFGLEWVDTDATTTFDIVPAFMVSDEPPVYEILSMKRGRHRTSIAAARTELDSLDDQFGWIEGKYKFRDLVKLAKAWNNTASLYKCQVHNVSRSRFKSFHLELICYNFGSIYVLEERTPLRAVFRDLLVYMCSMDDALSVVVPGCDGSVISTFSAFSDHCRPDAAMVLRSIREDLNVAQRAVELELFGRLQDALENWRQLFGPDRFPSIDVQVREHNAEARAAHGYFESLEPGFADANTERAFDWQFKDEYGFAVLVDACANGKRNVVEKLADTFSSLQGFALVAPIEVARQNGHLEIAQLLLDVCDYSEGTLQNLFFRCCRSGDLMMLILLLDRFPTVFEERELLWKGLEAATSWNQCEVVELLAARGIGVFAEIKDSLLCTAVFRNAVAVAGVLLRHGANVNTESNTSFRGHRPLLIASHYGNEEMIDLLLKQEGLQVNYTSHDIPLVVASGRGLVGIVDRLLKHKANVNAMDGELFRSLDVAVDGMHATTVECLMSHGAQVWSDENRTCASPLEVAAMHGDLKVLSILLRWDGWSDEQEQRQGNLNRALLYASQHSSDDIVTRLLLAEGASVDYCRPPLRNTALLYASFGGHVGVVTALLEAGASVAHRSSAGESALTLAATVGSVEVIREILQHAVHNVRLLLDVGSNNDPGVTPLYIAALHGFRETAASLVEAGADVSVRDKSNKGPLVAASMNDHAGVVSYLLSLSLPSIVDDISQSTLYASVYDSIGAFGALVGHLSASVLRDSVLSTCFSAAAYNGSVQVMRFLRERFGSTWFLSRAINTASALHVAVKRRSLGVILELVRGGGDYSGADARRGVSPDIIDRVTGLTPLFHACANGDVECVRELLKAGASPNVFAFDPFKRPRVPLWHAIAGKESECVLELLLHGADPFDVQIWEIAEGIRDFRIHGMLLGAMGYDRSILYEHKQLSS